MCRPGAFYCCLHYVLFYGCCSALLVTFMKIDVTEIAEVRSSLFICLLLDELVGLT